MSLGRVANSHWRTSRQWHPIQVAPDISGILCSSELCGSLGFKSEGFVAGEGFGLAGAGEEVRRQAVDWGEVGVDCLPVGFVPAAAGPFPVAGFLDQSTTDGVEVDVVDRGQHRGL